MDEAFNLRIENSLLRNRLAQAEVDMQQREEQRREVRRQLGEVSRGNAALAERVEEYRASAAKQLQRLQGQLEERNNEISLLASQKEVLEESNGNLGELLRRANNKIIELTRQLAGKNRFIKECIDREGSQDE